MHIQYFRVILSRTFYDLTDLQLGRKSGTASDITATYIKCAQLMEGLADAILRLFEVQKDLGKLSGVTARVYNLFYSMKKPEVLPLPLSREFPPNFEDSEILSFRNVTVYKPDGRILVKVSYSCLFH